MHKLKHTSTQTSQSLIIRAKQRDKAAWDRLVKLYSPLVYFWCKGSGLDSVDIHDVFQDVFHSVSLNLEKFRPRKSGSFRGWLRTITRNKIADHFRKARSHPDPVGGTEAQQFLQQFPATHSSEREFGNENVRDETEIEHLILRNALAGIREQFQPTTWQAFWMVVIDGRAAADVAADLGMQQGTVRVAKSRVLKRLRMELGDQLD